MEREKREKEVKKEFFHWWEDPETVERIKQINESLCKIHEKEFIEYL